MIEFFYSLKSKKNGLKKDKYDLKSNHPIKQKIIQIKLKVIIQIIVNKIFRDGIEIANFNNDFTVYDFYIDNTDISRMAITLKNK